MEGIILNNITYYFNGLRTMKYGAQVGLEIYAPTSS